MKRIIIYLIVLINYGSCVIGSHILRETRKFVPDNLSAYASKGLKNVNNYSIIAYDYVNYLINGIKSPSFYGLITEETLKHGYKPLRLTAIDIHKIKEMVESFFLTKQNQDNFDYFVSPVPSIPEWLSKDYENITQTLIGEILNDFKKSVQSSATASAATASAASTKPIDDTYSFLGPEEIRIGLVEYIFESWYQSKHKNKEYIYLIKENSQKNKLTPTDFQKLRDSLKESLKKDIESSLQDARYGFIYIDEISDDGKDILKHFNLKHFEINNLRINIIVKALDLYNQATVTKLENIHSQIKKINKENDYTKLSCCIVAAFGDRDKKIPNDFGSLLKSFLNNIAVIGSNITSIGDFFLNGFYTLEAIDLSYLSKIIYIGGSFLFQCSRLEAIDLSSLSNITSIGDRFLYGCSSLKAIDLSSLSKVTSIGIGFLYQCTNLKVIDISHLSKVTSIGDYFINGRHSFDGCSSLKAIDLSSLSNVTSIGNHFLHGCNSLKTIDLSSLSNVTWIGDCFLYKCSSLEIIDLSPLSNVASIGNNFINICTSLKAIDLSSLSKITSIGKFFLFTSTNLEVLDLSGLSNVTSIGDEFLYGCRKLKVLDLSALSNVTFIGKEFLSVCSNLEAIDLSHLLNVRSIGEKFLFNCPNLKTIYVNKTLYDLMLKTFGEYFKQRYTFVISNTTSSSSAAASSTASAAAASAS